MAKSEERTDFWGNKTTVHYDDDGKKTGESREEKTFLGDQRTVHYDNSGSKVGESCEEKTFLGDQRTVHYEKSGKKIGQSENEKTFLGDRYTNHDGSVPYLKSRTVESPDKHNAPANDTSYGDSGGSHEGVYRERQKESATTLATPEGDNTRLGCAVLLIIIALVGGYLFLLPDIRKEMATTIQPTLPQTNKSTSAVTSWTIPGEAEAKALDRAHSEIDEVYKTVMASLAPIQQEALRQEEREWIKWRDAEADRIARTTSEGGSAYRVDRLNAMIDLVKKRTEYLRQYKAKVSSNASDGQQADTAKKTLQQQPTKTGFDPRLEAKLLNLCLDFYHSKGEWAGKARIVKVNKMRLESTGPGQWKLHAAYDYASNSRFIRSGSDQRCFYISTHPSGTFYVRTMGSYMSARF